MATLKKIKLKGRKPVYLYEDDDFQLFANSREHFVKDRFGIDSHITMTAQQAEEARTMEITDEYEHYDIQYVESCLNACGDALLKE